MKAKVKNIKPETRTIDNGKSDIFTVEMTPLIGKIVDVHKKKIENWYFGDVPANYNFHASWLDFDYDKTKKIGFNLRDC